MLDRNAMAMMQRCANEIKGLRGAVERLQPKAEAWDMMQQVLGFISRPTHGTGTDLVGQLEKEIAKIDNADREEAKAQANMDSAKEGQKVPTPDPSAYSSAEQRYAAQEEARNVEGIRNAAAAAKYNELVAAKVAREEKAHTKIHDGRGPG